MRCVALYLRNKTQIELNIEPEEIETTKVCGLNQEIPKILGESDLSQCPPDASQFAPGMNLHTSRA